MGWGGPPRAEVCRDYRSWLAEHYPGETLERIFASIDNVTPYT
jgi:hypothetical protein